MRSSLAFSYNQLSTLGAATGSGGSIALYPVGVRVYQQSGANVRPIINGTITAKDCATPPPIGMELCIWVQSTNVGNSVVASVSYNNGTSAITNSNTVSLASTSNSTCTVVSQHIVYPTNVTYSTSVTGSGGSGGTYGLDIVETRVR